MNEAPEFATRAWSDPWDMSNADDMLLDQPWIAQNAAGAAFGGGTLSFTLNGRCASAPCYGFLSPVWNGMSPGALRMGRDGIIGANTIDADTYRSLSIRMWISSRLSSAGIFWSRGPSANDAQKQGGMPVSSTSTPTGGPTATLVGDGRWHTYTFPLVNSPVFGKPIAWSGLINGLRLALNPLAGTAPTVKIDWIRLFQPGQSGSVPGVSAGASLYYSGGGATCDQLSGSQNIDQSALPAGTYDFYSDAACSAHVSGPVTIVPRPTPIVTAPSLAGSGDYATTFLRNPWDFNGSSDVARTGNICGASYTRTAGAFSGYNCKTAYTGYINDPFVNLHVGSGPYAIPSYLYHRVTVTYTYDGPFSLYGGCHGGTIGRLIWLDTNDKGGGARQTRPFVTYKDRTTFTFDLNAPASQLNDGPASTWTPFVLPKGQFVKLLRWDPSEDTCARWFRIHDIKLRADDAPRAGIFNIAWRDPRAAPGDLVWIYASREGSGTWAVIAGARPNSAAPTSYEWHTAGLTPGKYTVLVRVFRNGDPSNYGDSFGGGPVSI